MRTAERRRRNRIGTRGLLVVPIISGKSKVSQGVSTLAPNARGSWQIKCYPTRVAFLGFLEEVHEGHQFGFTKQAGPVQGTRSGNRRARGSGNRSASDRPSLIGRR